MAHKKSGLATMLRHMFCSGLIVMFELVALTSLASPAISGVAARQRNPWSGLVDVVVTVQGTSNDVADAEWNFSATNGATKETIPVKHIMRNGFDTESGSVWACKFVWDAKSDVGAVKIDDIVLTVDAKFLVGSQFFGGVQLWENGPYWAECNVGATKPEEYGHYFWWGGTVGYKRNSTNSGWVSVKDSSAFSFSSENCPTFNKSNEQLKSSGYLDSTGVLVAARDAATANLGAPWRMPTYAEIAALIGSCTTKWTTRNGVPGRLVTGQGAYSSKSIFLPAAGYCTGDTLQCDGAHGDYSDGYYWSTSPYNYRSTWFLSFYSSNINGFTQEYFDGDRYKGFSVRPVRGFADGGFVPVDAVTTHLSIDCTSIGQVLDMTARQRYPWNGLVDIVVTIQGDSIELAGAECSFVATNTATKLAIPVEHITRNGVDTGSGNVWKRRFIWDAKADIGAVKIDDVALTVDDDLYLGGVQLWENGPYWAECNVGATKPEEYGYYFWWGDTVGCKRNENGWVSVKDPTGFCFNGYPDERFPTWNKSISQLQKDGYVDATGNLVAAHDASTAYFGSSWRMPTYSEFAELIANCNLGRATRNGVAGILVTGRGAYASKSIFLPCAGDGNHEHLNNTGEQGYYWSATLNSTEPFYAGCLWANRASIGPHNKQYRYMGFSVRSVRGSAK